MDSETKSHPVHENHGGHVCHKCGWAFPNPHPSAKHRRAHKKVCGKIEGFKLAKDGDKHQSDSDLSDDDHNPAQVQPSLLLSELSAKGSDAKTGSDSFRAEGEGAGDRSEEEVFSDAVAKFGDVDPIRTIQRDVALDARGVEMNSEKTKDLSQTVEKIVDLDARGVRMTAEESNDLALAAGEVSDLDTNGLDVSLEETQQSSQAAEEVVGSDNHGIEKNAEEIQDSSKTAGEVVDLGVCGAADSNMKEMDPSHGLDAGLELHGEENKESSRETEPLALDVCVVDVNTEKSKGNDGVNHMLKNPPNVETCPCPSSSYGLCKHSNSLSDNEANDKHMSSRDQFQDLSCLQTKPDKDLQSSHSTNSESILDDRIHLALEQTQDSNLSSFSSHRASLADNIADDTREDKDNSASEIMNYSTSVGPDEEAKHSEECTLSAEDAEEKEIDEDDKVSVIKILHNDVASDSSGIGVQSCLKDTVTVATANFPSRNLIPESRERDLKISQVHNEQTSGPEGLKPLEESHQSIQSGPIESYADSGDFVGVSKATDSSLPIAGVVPSNRQVQDDILLIDRSGSGSVLEEAATDQSSLKEGSTMEKLQDIELASIECAAKDVNPHELTIREDSLNAESAVVNTISSKTLLGGSNEMEVTVASLAESEQHCSLGKDEIEATNLSLAEHEKHCSLGNDGTAVMNASLVENEQHFSLEKDDSSHQLSHEVSPETSAVPMTGESVSDSLEVAEVHRATETPHVKLSMEEDSGCDLPYELISGPPSSSIADCDEEAQVLVNNSNAWPNGDRDSRLNQSHEVIKENSTVPVSGGNVGESVEEAEVQEKAANSGGFDSDRKSSYDSSHMIVGEIFIQPVGGSENAYSVDKTEVHETSTIDANGPGIAYEETKANQTNVGGKYAQEGASFEASPSIIATIPESVTDDSKISSLHHEVVETDKLENNKDFALGSKDMAVESDSAPFSETADWGHAEHNSRELKMEWSIEAGENKLDIQNPTPDVVSLSTGTGPCIQVSSILEKCKEEDFAARDVCNNHAHSVTGAGGDAVPIGNMNASILATDASVSSVSQDDSLEGHWGSISDTPTPKEVSDPSLKKGSTCGGTHADNSDVFEPPSFLTLVEPNKGDKRQTTSEIQSAQKPAPSSQPGWFPSLTHVVNESQGRKKNEEIIEKVVNWSPGKPHTPLRSLLVEANIESKHKPSQKIQDRPSSPAPREESALQEKGIPAKTGNAEVQKETAAKGDIEKEWSSPARLPVMKRERRKVRGWVPFVCCSSIN